MSYLVRIGAHLNGQSVDTGGQSQPKKMTRLENAYLSNACLATITTLGILIAAVGAVALVASQGYLPGLVSTLHAGGLSTSVLMIVGATAISVGGAASVVHLAMLALKHHYCDDAQPIVNKQTTKPQVNDQPPTIPPRRLVPTTPSLPTTLYQCSDEGVSSLTYWQSNTLDDRGLPAAIMSTAQHVFPVAASPSHGQQRFALDGHKRQYVVFDDGMVINSMDFQLSSNAQFMKPNVDTMLACFGIGKLFKQEGLRFNRGIDIGAGSGFIGKYIALLDPSSLITLIDIDPAAATYMNSPGSGMPTNVQIECGDAITKLSQEGDQYDLIVSNPPYVPTLQETQSSSKIAVDNPSFWGGTGMICHMLEDALEKMPANGHLVILVPSTALKSQRLFNIFQTNANRFHARILHQQEVAYKSWFAGDGKVQHLLANPQEAARPTRFGGANLDLFVGITPPGSPRECRVEDGRRACAGYYWQMVYVIDFKNDKPVS